MKYPLEKDNWRKFEKILQQLLLKCYMKKKRNFSRKICKNKDLGNSMPSEMDNILIEFNWYMKPDKMPYIIYGHYKFLIKT